MEWNEDEICAAREALRTIGEAVDTISSKAIQLEGLLAAMDHAVKSREMPNEFLEATLWLASDVIREIRCAAHKLS